MKTSFCCILAILFVALHAQSAIYVKPGATGGGTSWADAADLEAALAQAQLSGGDVYVAKGFYQPKATLMIANGVSVYGGFAGVDSGEMPHGRDLVNNETLISGDKNGDDTWVLHNPEFGTSEVTDIPVVNDGALNIPAFADDYETVGPNTANMGDNLPRLVSMAASATATVDGLVLVGAKGSNTKIDGAACNIGHGIFGGESSKTTIRNCRVIACYGAAATVSAYNQSTMTIVNSSIEHCTTTAKGLVGRDSYAKTYLYGVRFIGNVQTAVGCLVTSSSGALGGCHFERNYFKRMAPGNVYDAVCVGVNTEKDVFPVTNCTFVANSSYDMTGKATPVVNSVSKGCQMRFCSFVRNRAVVDTDATTVTAAGAFACDGAYKSVKGCTFLQNTLTVIAPNATVAEAATILGNRAGTDNLQTLIIDSCTFVDNEVSLTAPLAENIVWARGVVMCPTADEKGTKMLGVYNSTFTGSTAGADVVYGSPAQLGVGCLAFNNVLWATEAAARTPRLVNVGNSRAEVRNSIVVDPTLFGENITVSDICADDPLIGEPTGYVTGYPPVCRLGALLPGLRTTYDIAYIPRVDIPGNYFYRAPGSSSWVQPQNNVYGGRYPEASGVLSTSALDETRPDSGSTIGAVQSVDPLAETGHTFLLRVDPVDAGYIEGCFTRVCAADGSLAVTAVSTNGTYAFKKWKTLDDATYSELNPLVITAPGAGTTTLKAFFGKSSLTYTFNLGAYGLFTESGTATTNLTVAPGEAFTVPAYTLADGYEFCRWNFELPTVAGDVDRTFDAVCAMRESFVAPGEDLAAALELAGAYSGRATVTLLAGTHQLSEAVAIPANVHLVGAEGSEIRTDSSKFILDNTAFAAQAVTTEVRNVTFVGGGVTLGSRQVSFIDCVFTNATAKGADAAVLSNTNAWFSGCSFFAGKSAFKNSARGAISQFNDCFFGRNGLNTGSSTIDSERATTLVSNCVFVANETTSGQLIKTTYAPLYIDSCSFADNVASSATSLIRTGKDAEGQYVADSLFLNNIVGGTADGANLTTLVYGPSRWMNASSESLLRIEGCSFVSNVVIKSCATDTQLSCSIICYENGCLPGVVNCVFDENTLHAEQTGGTGKIVASVLPVRIVRFDTAICNCTFVRNEATDGTIYVSATDAGKSIEVFNCVFGENDGNKSLGFSGSAVATVKMWGCVVDPIADARASYERCNNTELKWKSGLIEISGRLIRPFEPVSKVRSLAYPAVVGANGIVAVRDGETYLTALGTTTRSATAPYSPLSDMFGKYDARRIAGAYRRQWPIGLKIVVR